MNHHRFRAVLVTADGSKPLRTMTIEASTYEDGYRAAAEACRKGWVIAAVTVGPQPVRLAAG